MKHISCGFVIIVLIFPSTCLSDDSTISGYSELGTRSTAEDYEEEDEDSDYAYQNYHLKLKQELSPRLNYDISTFIYDKDYTSRDSLDNISRVFKSNLAYSPEKSGEESNRLDLKLKYNEKRYNSSPASEYNRIRAEPLLTVKKKDFYTLNLSAGLDNFDYLSKGEKDQHKIFGKIGGKGYFLQKKLALLSSCKIEALEKKITNRRKTKHDITGGFDYIFELPWIYKFRTTGNFSQRDTKENEVRDEDYDYEYRLISLGTEHRINPRLKAELKYEYFKKDYISADLDHSGFYIQNGWNYEIIDTEKEGLWLDLSAAHKDVNYTIKTWNDYRKETAQAKITCLRKKNWKTSLSLEGNFYNYNDSSNDKNRYYVLISGEKLFLEGNLLLSMDFKLRYTDYDRMNDSEQDAVRIAFRYKF